MAWWKQIAITAVLVVGVGFAWARFVPEAAPFLKRVGLPVAETVAGASVPRGGQGSRRGGLGAIEVIAQPVGVALANARTSAIGDGRAIRSVAVMPLSTGRLTDVLVFPGDRVSAGEVIARLDAQSEAIELARTELSLADAESNLERFERLRGTGAATEVQLREAQLALEKARLEVRNAQLELERRNIVAPISGLVGILPVEMGMQVGTQTEIATIDDRSRILVDFRVPERFVGRIDVGDRVNATALARPELDLGGEIVALDNRIDRASRTLRVQAALDNSDDTLRAGMAFSLVIGFAGEPHPAIDPLAIQWGADGAFVWVVREGRAVRVPVRIVQRSSEHVLVAAQIEAGELVVTEGIQRLRDGLEVTIHGAPRSNGDGDDGAALDVSRAAPHISDT
jgi:RND family efflux transporter MFP subunit